MLLPCFLEVARRDRGRDARPDRARPERRAQPRLGPLPLPLRARAAGAPTTRRSSSPARSGARFPPSCSSSCRACAAGAGSTSRRSTSPAPDDALLLKSFVWADQPDRLERLDRAVETLRAEPPELEQGDFVERLPQLLAERLPGALTVVFQTAVAATWAEEDGSALLTRPRRAGRQFPLGLVSVSRPAPGERPVLGPLAPRLARRREATCSRTQAFTASGWSGWRDHLRRQSAPQAGSPTGLPSPARAPRPLRL